MNDFDPNQHPNSLASFISTTDGTIQIHNIKQKQPVHGCTVLMQAHTLHNFCWILLLDRFPRSATKPMESVQIGALCSRRCLL